MKKALLFIIILLNIVPISAQELEYMTPEHGVRLNGTLLQGKSTDLGSARMGEYRYSAEQIDAPERDLRRYYRYTFTFHPSLQLIVDELMAYRPVSWEWVLLCTDEPDINPNGRRILCPRDDSMLEIIPVAPKSLDLGSAAADEGGQWLAAAKLDREAAETRFISVIRHAGENTQPLTVLPLGSNDWAGVKIVGESVYCAAIRLYGGSEHINAGRIEGDGKVMAGTFSRENSEVRSLFLSNGRVLNADGKLVLSSDHSLTALLRYTPHRVDADVKQNQPGAVFIRTTMKPTSMKLSTGSKIRWRYDPIGSLTALYLPAGKIKATLEW